MRKKVSKDGKLFFQGMLIGFADLVPGISGGTVAFLSGKYEKLLATLKAFRFRYLIDLFFFRFRKVQKKWDIRFLTILFLGVFSSILLFSNLFYSLYNKPHCQPFLLSFFFGSMCGATALLLQQFPPFSKKIPLYAIIGFFLLYSTFNLTKECRDYQIPMPQYLELEGEFANYNKEKGLLSVTQDELLQLYRNKKITKNFPIYSGNNQPILVEKILSEVTMQQIFSPKIILSGLLASCAMLLPGISGSSLLFVLGIYHPTLHAIFLFTHGGEGWLSSLFFLLNLAFGIVLGLLFFSRSILWALKKHFAKMYGLILGMMIASLTSLWPCWEYQQVIDPISENIVYQPLTKTFFWNINGFYCFLIILFAIAIFLFLIFKRKKLILLNS